MPDSSGRLSPGLEHCDRCEGFGAVADWDEPDESVVSFVESWAAENGFAFSRDGRRVARLSDARRQG